MAFRISPYPQVEALIPPEDVNHWTTYNPTPASRRIDQVRRACREILDRGDVTSLDLVGLGEAGAWVLIGAATGPRAGRVTVELGEFSGDTDQVFLDRLNVPLLRRAGDLKTAAVLLAPRRLVLHGLDEGTSEAVVPRRLPGSRRGRHAGAPERTHRGVAGRDAGFS